MRARDQVAIGWCDPGQVDGGFAVGMARLVRARDDRIGDLVRIQGTGLLSRIRNELVHTFLTNSDNEWIWLVDTDERPTIEAFDKLVDAVSYQSRPIMSGVVFAAYPGDLYPTPVPIIYRHDGHGYLPIIDYPDDSVIPIDGAGTGCLLIHRRVLEALRDAADDGAKPWCWFQDGPTGDGRWLSEDLTFSTRVRAAGFPMFAHTGAVLPHRKAFWQSEEHFKAWRATQ